MKLETVLAGIVLSAVINQAGAEDFKLGTLSIGRPHARATAAGQPSGGGYMTLGNQGADDRLIEATAAVASRVELHSMSMQGDVMRMRQVDAIALLAGQTVELKPGGLHIMFVGLKAPLKAGEKFPLTLKFEKAGAVTVDVRIEAAAGSDRSEHRH